MKPSSTINPVVLLILLMLLSLAVMQTGGVAPSESVKAQSLEDYQSFLPLVSFYDPNPAPLPPPIPMSSTPPINFEETRQTLQSQGLDLTFNKIGFHYGSGGNTNGLTNWITQLDTAGVPIFLKGADSAEFLYTAQETMKVSGVPHTLVYRRSVPYPGADPTQNPDLPNYDLDPATAALNHWTWHKAGFPTELDPDYIWFETVNEVDKNRSPWLAEFALETAKLTLADGYKWVAFGWSSGEPEPEHWQSPAMLEFLRLVGDNPDKLAIGLHEYSYRVEEISYIYPYLVGRFQTLFDICDQNGIPRPTIMITEWGWEYDNVPAVSAAMADIQWAAWLYAAYPEVKGAALWYLGPGFGGIADQAQQLIAPMVEYSQSHYFAITPGQGAIDTTLFEP